MIFQELEIAGAWVGVSKIHVDDRGLFREWYKASDFTSSSGIEFKIAQANSSISKKNVIRGIHFSTSKVGQAKWVTCTAGKILDVIVDLRPNSPTFKKWVSIEISSVGGESIYIPGGCGHAFLALENDSVVTYLLSSEYSVLHEHAINFEDPDIAIDWPGIGFLVSDKDRLAPKLADTFDRGILSDKN